MSKDITEILKLKNSIQTVRDRIYSDNGIVIEWIKKLQNQCPHPTSATTKKYYGGGYDYLSSVRVTVTCTICEKILEAYDDPKHQGVYG